MNWVQIELFFIIIAVALVCVIPGVFLVLREVALMSDAISHAVLLGIAGMFLLIRKLHSPLLLLGASISALMTICCTELLVNTKLLKKDAAIGLVFPLFFSIGVILITLYARDVHIDSDMVLLGELALAPFNRLIVGGSDYGPYALWQLSIILIINSVIIFSLYKEFSLAIFDPEYARITGFYPTLMHYLLMILTSITVVSVFDIVGAVVVVALIIVPAATACLIAKRLFWVLFTAVACGIHAAIGGYLFAGWADVSIAGSIAMIAGIQFVAAFLSALRGSKKSFY